VLVFLVVCILLLWAQEGFAGALLLNLGPEELVEAGGLDIDVGTYSVPSYVEWNNDGLKDLIIGGGDGKVRVYLNGGTESEPAFSNFFYAQSDGNDLSCPPAGCLGCFPRVVYWDADARKDLLAGHGNGTVKIFRNIGTDENPTFDGGTLLKVGQPASKVDIDVGDRATPSVVDWNNDGKKDLVVGALDGKIYIFINKGTDTAPDFLDKVSAQLAGPPLSDLVVPGQRSSPVVLDLNGDGKKDLLTGNTNGQLLFYSNVGTDQAPLFSNEPPLPVESNGVPISIPSSPRTRPFVCDWTGDGYLDVLIGVYDGKVHLYQSIPQVGDLDKDYDVDFVDFALFAGYWQQTGCDKCGGADLAGNDSYIGYDDLQQLVENWLAPE
jgi:hypothetical protein